MLRSDRQQSKIWIGLAVAAVGCLAIVGCGGGGDDQGQQQQQTASGGSGGSGGPAAKAPGGGGGQLPGTSPSGQQQLAGGPPPKDATPPPGARPDPFKPWFNTTPPPPNVLTMVEPVRIAMTGTTEPAIQPGVEIQEVPNRRVAGILNGNGVYALLDGGPNGPEVVKPGQVLDDGYMVAMINQNSVTLRKKVNTQTYTQVVPLTDAGSSPSMASSSGMIGGGGPRMGPGFGGGRVGGGPSAAGAAGGGGAAGR